MFSYANPLVKFSMVFFNRFVWRRDHSDCTSKFVTFYLLLVLCQFIMLSSEIRHNLLIQRKNIKSEMAKDALPHKAALRNNLRKKTSETIASHILKSIRVNMHNGQSYHHSLVSRTRDYVCSTVGIRISL